MERFSRSTATFTGQMINLVNFIVLTRAFRLMRGGPTAKQKYNLTAGNTLDGRSSVLLGISND